MEQESKKINGFYRYLRHFYELEKELATREEKKIDCFHDFLQQNTKTLEGGGGGGEEKKNY